MEIEHYTGLFGVIVLILDIWAIVSVLSSNNGTFSKVIWIVIVLLLPILGFIIWLLLGPRAPRTRY